MTSEHCQPRGESQADIATVKQRCWKPMPLYSHQIEWCRRFSWRAPPTYPGHDHCNTRYVAFQNQQEVGQQHESGRHSPLPICMVTGCCCAKPTFPAKVPSSGDGHFPFHPQGQGLVVYHVLRGQGLCFPKKRQAIKLVASFLTWSRVTNHIQGSSWSSCNCVQWLQSSNHSYLIHLQRKSIIWSWLHLKCILSFSLSHSQNVLLAWKLVWQDLDQCNGTLPTIGNPENDWRMMSQCEPVNVFWLRRLANYHLDMFVDCCICVNI